MFFIKKFTSKWKAFKFHSAHLHPGVQMGTGKLFAEQIDKMPGLS